MKHNLKHILLKFTSSDSQQFNTCIIPEDKLGIVISIMNLNIYPIRTEEIVMELILLGLRSMEVLI
jgi:hypothetical protein